VTVLVATGVLTGTVITNTATVTSSTPVAPDSILTDAEPTRIRTLADLAIDLSAQPTVIAGTQMSVKAAVTNNGPSDAVSAVVTMTLPASVTVDLTATNAALAGSGWAASAGPNNTVLLNKTDGPFVVGSSFDLPVVVKVDPEVEPGTLLEYAGRVGSDTPESNLLNNLDTTPTIVIGEADLRAEKTGPATVVAGDVVTWTVVVSNAGPSTAQSVVLYDVVPTGLSALALTLEHDDVLTPCTATCFVGDVAVGERVTITVAARVNANVPAGTVLTNLARASSPTRDPLPANNTDTHPTTVEALAWLEVAKRDLADPATAGGQLTYEIVVRNLGPSDAQNVVISDTLPTSTTYVSSVPSAGVCAESQPGRLGCALGTLAAGSSATVQVTVRLAPAIAAFSTLTNTVEAGSTTPLDPRSVLTDTEQTGVIAVADLAIDLASPPFVTAGTDMMVTATVRNLGPSDALNASTTITLPAGTLVDLAATNAALAGSGWTAAAGPNNTVILTKVDGPFEAGDAFVLQIAVDVASDVLPGTQLEFVGRVTSDTPDNNPANNIDTARTAVIGVADLAVAKTGPVTVTAGTAISFTIVVSNAGPSTARAVTLQDVIPAGINGASLVVQKGAAVSTCGVVCLLGDIAVGERVTITVLGAVAANLPAGVTVTNSVTVDSSTTDPDRTNNSDTHPVEIVTAAQLAISKRDLTDPTAAGGQLTYEVRVRNFGPSDALNVAVTDTLPVSTTYVSNTGGCTPSGSLLGCTLGTVPANGLVTFQVTVLVASNVPTGTVLSNAVVLTTTTPLVPGSVLTDTEETGIRTVADLAIQLEAPATVIAGRGMTVTATVANLGPSDALNASVTITLPAGTLLNPGATNAALAGSGWTVASGPNNTVILTKIDGPFAATDSFTLPIVLFTDPDIEPGTQLEFVGRVTSDTPDANLSNNIDTARTVVISEADLGLQKSGPVTVTAGTRITWTVVISNSGPSRAHSASVVDVIPAGVSQVVINGVRSGAGTIACTGGFCELGDVAVGEFITLTIGGFVDPALAPETILTNRASVSALSRDPNPANNSDTHPTTVETEAELIVAKRDLVDPATAGGALTYEIVVVNNGPSNAQGVVVTDTLPAGTTHVSNTGGCTVAGQSVTCAFGTIVVGGSKSVQITVGLAPSLAQGATLTNTVVLTSSTPLAPTSVVTDSEPTGVRTLADLALVLDAPATTVAGLTMPVTATVRNLGPSDAVSAVVTITLPSGTVVDLDATNAALAGSGWVASSGPNNTVILSKTDGPFLAGTEFTLPVTVLVDSAVEPGSSLEFRGQIASQTPEISLANNVDTADTSVRSVADVGVAKTGPTSVVAGQTITWTVVITNAGPSTAQSVGLADTLPQGVSFTGIRATQADGSAIVCATTACMVGDIAVGGRVTVTVTGLVAASVPTGTVLTNVAAVTADSVDPDSTNNSDPHGTTVQTLAELVIAKRDLADPATAGGSLTYAIDVTNNGPSDAQAVVFTDTLPAGTAFQSASAGCAASGATVTCRLGSVAAGSTKSVQITVVLASSLEAGSTLTNTVVLTSATPLAPTSVLTDEEPTGVTTLADLSLVLAAPATTVAGTSMMITATIQNNGPSDAANAAVTVTVPSGVVPDIDATNAALAGSGWTAALSPNNTVLLCKNEGAFGIASLSPCPGSQPFTAGEAASLPIIVKIAPDVEPGTSLEFLGTIRSDTPEANLANNSDDADTSVVGVSNLVLDKTGTLTATAGMPISYTIVVTNNGPSTAQSVDIKDTLPAGVSLTSASVQRSGGGASACAGQGTICQVGDMALGEVVTITVSGIVDSAVVTGTVLTNLATVFADSLIGESSRVSDTHTTRVQAVANLRVAKQGPATILAGDKVTYQVAVRNDGPSDARSVVLSDTLAAGLSEAVATVSHQGACVVGGQLVTCTIPVLPAGQTANATITAKAASSLTGTVSNTVAATSLDGQPVTSAPVTATVDTAVDLEMFKAALPTANAGTTIAYTLTVVNRGPSDAQGVAITDTLPVPVTFIATDAPCSETFTGSRLVVCTVGTLVAGAAAQYRILVRADADIEPGTSLENVAEVTSATRELNPTNNRADADTSIVGLADLVLDKSGPATAVAGDLVTYTIRTRNNGPSTAKAVDIKDQLPPGVTLQNATVQRSGAGTAACGGTVCQVGDMAVGEFVTVTVVARVDPGLTGVLTNTAAIFSATPDPDGSNNSDTVISPVTALAWITIEKSDDIFDPAPPGSPVAYAIEVRNEGPSDAVDVTVTDALPAGMSYLGSRPAVCSEATPGLVSCSLGRLRAGDSKLVQIFVRISMQVAGGTVLRNIATVATTTPTTPDSKLQDIEETRVEEQTGPPADLDVVKQSSGAIIEPGAPFTYTLIVTNKGPQTARDAKLVDVLPLQVSLISVTSDQGLCTEGILCLLGNIAPGARVTVRVAVRLNEGIAPGTPIRNAVAVVSDAPDPNPNDNESEIENPAGPIVRITVDKRALVNAVQAGKQLKYEFVVKNEGPSAAPSVIMTDTLPVGMRFIASETPGLCVGVPPRTVVCALGRMSPQTQRTFRILAEATDSEPGRAVNHTRIDVPGSKIDPGSRLTDTATVTITTKPTAIVLQTFTATGVKEGIRVTWITAIEYNTYGFHIWRSTGPDFALAVRITPDLVPALGGVGSEYTFFDDTAAEGTLYYYWLEEFELDETATLAGPVTAHRGGGFSSYLPFVNR
jgi:uncharacterized repeat protein (TIGR01451 family)